MAGSPIYLKALDDLFGLVARDDSGAIVNPFSWEDLDKGWHSLPGHPSTEHLTYLAAIGLHLYISQSGLDPDAVHDKWREMHIAKNAGYAGMDNPDPWANFRMSDKFGVSAFKGTLVRLSDKYIRTVNLRKDPNNEQVGESILDSLLDFVAYCLIAVCIWREIFPPRKPEIGPS